MTQHDCSPISAAAVPTTVTLPAAASHHAMGSDLRRSSQRRCASRRPLRQQTARHAMHQHDCSPIGAAAVHKTVTLPAVAPNHAMRSDFGRSSQRRRASRRPLRQQTARHAMTQHDCSPIGAAAVHTTVTLPAAAPHHACAVIWDASASGIALVVAPMAADSSPRHRSARLQPKQCCSRAHNSYPVSCSPQLRCAK